MKKKLLTESIANELEGASLFFTRSATPSPADNNPTEKQGSPAPEPPTPDQPPAEEPRIETARSPKVQKSEKTNGNTMPPRYHDTTVSRYQGIKQPQVHGVAIELVRKAVKEFGKEAATHRFTEAEKKELADLIYTYKNTGIRTSENEITRIAVNFIIEDYRQNGENSVLHKILEALNG